MTGYHARLWRTHYPGTHSSGAVGCQQQRTTIRVHVRSFPTFFVASCSRRPMMPVSYPVYRLRRLR